jgi:hypothetical protein
LAAATVDTRWNFCGLQVVRLENEQLRVDILPQLGAKIYSFIHRPSGRELLWQNPHLAPVAVPFGAKFDDTWSGGWDELLPNDIPVAFPNGDVLPDHGEVWSQPSEWQVDEAGGELAAVRFTSYGRVLPTCFEKRVSLRGGEPFIRLHYKFTNFGSQPLPFLWNIHPPMAVSPQTRLDVPAVAGFVDPWNSERFEAGRRFEWPFITTRQGERVDLRQVQTASSSIADFFYLPQVEQGWYAVTDRAAQVGFGLVFPLEVFPHLWLFRSFGGWRGLNMLILEASTGYPNDLKVAQSEGHCTVLAPGASLETEALAVAYAGVTGVQRIDANGIVFPSD